MDGVKGTLSKDRQLVDNNTRLDSGVLCLVLPRFFQPVFQVSCRVFLKIGIPEMASFLSVPTKQGSTFGLVTPPLGGTLWF